MAITSLEAFAAAYDLSPLERQRFGDFDRFLLETAEHTNLIARGTLPERWERHYHDSAQLFTDLPKDAETLLDIGAGAGFPGIVLGILAAERLPKLHLTLADSVGKKARFLEEATRLMGLENVTATAERVEVFHVKHQTFDVITARAVAALDKLLALAAPLLAPGGLLIFPKGEQADEELTRARQGWRFESESRPSVTHPDARILLIRQPEHR